MRPSSTGCLSTTLHVPHPRAPILGSRCPKGTVLPFFLNVEKTKQSLSRPFCRYPLPKLRVFARVDVVVRLVGGADWATPTGSLVASTSSSGGAAASADGSWKALPKAGSRNEEVNMQIAVTNLEIQLNELVPGAQVRRRRCEAAMSAGGLRVTGM